MQQRLLALVSLVFVAAVGGCADCCAQPAKQVVVEDSDSGIRLGAPALRVPNPGKPLEKQIYPIAPQHKWDLKLINDRLPDGPDESARLRAKFGVGSYAFEPVRGPQNVPTSSSPVLTPIYGGGTTEQWNVRAINERPVEKPDDESARLRSNFGANGSWLDQLAAPQTVTGRQSDSKREDAKPLYQQPKVQFGEPTNLSTSKAPTTMIPAAKPAFEFNMNVTIPVPKKPILERLLLQGRVVKCDKNDQNHLTFGILGIQWMRLTYPTVVQVFPGTPAERAGIRPRDQIIAIDSESLLGRSIDDVTSAIIGVPGTTMIVSIEREGKLRAAVIVRMDVDEIKDPEVRAAYGRSIRRLADPDDPADFRF